MQQTTSVLAGRLLLGAVALVELGLAALMLTHPNGVMAWAVAYWASPLALITLLVLERRADRKQRIRLRTCAFVGVLVLWGVFALWVYQAIWAALLVFAALLPLRVFELVASLTALMLATSEPKPACEAKPAFDPEPA